LSLISAYVVSEAARKTMIMSSVKYALIEMGLNDTVLVDAIEIGLVGDSEASSLLEGE
jgi:hypothetical protein